MLASARWLLTEVKEALVDASKNYPDYKLIVTGHSLGAGIAVLLTMMVRELQGSRQFATADCVTFACPACVTLELAKSCTSYVTCVVNGADVVPQFSQGALDDLRENIGTSHLFDELCGVQPQCLNLGQSVSDSLSKVRV
jgi:hypothetical protein